MRFEFIVKEQYLFDLQYFLSMKYGNIKNTRFISMLIIITIFSSHLVYIYIYEKDILKIIILGIFYFIFTFLYNKYLTYSFEKNIRKFVQKNFSDSIGEKVFLEFKDGYLISGDLENKTEIKVKKEEIKNIYDEKNYLFIKLMTNIYVTLPKENIKSEDLKNFKKLFDKN